MNTNKLILAVVFAAGAFTIALAGPSSQISSQQEKARTEIKAKAHPADKDQLTCHCGKCACCTTKHS